MEKLPSEIKHDNPVCNIGAELVLCKKPFVLKFTDIHCHTYLGQLREVNEQFNTYLNDRYQDTWEDEDVVSIFGEAEVIKNSNIYLFGGSSNEETIITKISVYIRSAEQNLMGQLKHLDGCEYSIGELRRESVNLYLFLNKDRFEELCERIIKGNKQLEICVSALVYWPVEPDYLPIHKDFYYIMRQNNGYNNNHPAILQSYEFNDKPSHNSSSGSELSQSNELLLKILSNIKEMSELLPKITKANKIAVWLLGIVMLFVIMGSVK